MSTPSGDVTTIQNCAPRIREMQPFSMWLGPRSAFHKQVQARALSAEGFDTIRQVFAEMEVIRADGHAVVRPS